MAGTGHEVEDKVEGERTKKGDAVDVAKVYFTCLKGIGKYFGQVLLRECWGRGSYEE